jgi:hypothetical protein
MVEQFGMSIRLEKPWRELNDAEVTRLGAELGVYQIGDSDGRVIRIGYAGGRSLFGLRGELKDALARHPPGENLRFRVEITSQYMSRYEELLMIHQAEHGRFPRENTDGQGRRVGRIHPA